MRLITGTNNDILAADNKTVTWLITCNGYYWSHDTYTYDSHTYEPKVISDSLYPIKQSRNKSELGIHAPIEFSFDLSNKDNVLKPADFEGQELNVRIIMESWVNGVLLEWNESTLDVGFADTEGVQWGDTTGGEWAEANGRFRWSFNVDRVETSYQKLTFHCTDFIQQYLEGDYPNGELLDSMFPDDVNSHDDTMTIAVPFGTAYIPLRAILESGDRAYFLGPATDLTYTIEKVRTPLGWGDGSTDEWTNADYEMAQYNFTLDGVTYKKFEPKIKLVDKVITRSWHPIIADEGAPTGQTYETGLWYDNNKYLDMPTKFIRSDLSSTTNPADVIQYLLEDWGVPADKIGTQSFEDAHDKYDTLGIEFNGAFYMKESRKKILSNMLNQCGSYIVVTDTVDLYMFEKTSVKTIDASTIYNANSSGPGSFRTNKITTEQSDSANILFREDDTPQDELKTSIVEPTGSSDSVSTKKLNTAFLSTDNRNGKRAGEMMFFRDLFRERDLSFQTLSANLLLQPNDVITISGSNYTGTSGTWDLLIDDISIDKDLLLSFNCTKYSSGFFNWEDSTPATLEVSTDTNPTAWVKPTTGGYASNGPPPDITGLVGEPWMRGAKFTWDALNIKDLKDYMINFRLQANDGSPNMAYPGTWQAISANQAFRFMTDAEQTTYGVDARVFCKVKARNIWFEASNSLATASAVCLNLNAQATDIDDFAITASKIFTKIPVLSADSWTDNSPASGSVAWNSHQIFFNGNQYNIAAGNTSYKYIYWVNAATSYSAATSNPTLTDDDFVIATNISGTHDLAWNAIANEVIGSAYIQTAAIQTAHIEDLAVTNAKINDLNAAKINAGYISADRIDSGTITAVKLNVSELSAITSNMGTVTIATNGYICSTTKTSYSSATAGFFIGYDTDDYKLNIGDDDNFFTWDGSTLELDGTLNVAPCDIAGGFLNSFHSFFFGPYCGFPFTAATSNDGLISINSDYLTVYADSSTANSEAIFSLDRIAPFARCGFTIYLWTLLNDPAGVTATLTYGDPETDNYFGFRLTSDAKIYAISSKSGSETAVELDFTIPNSTAYYSMSAHFNSNDDTPSIDFYCDGTLQTSITNASYLPIGTPSDKRFVIRVYHASDSANGIEIKVKELSVWCDWPGQSIWGGRYKSG